MSLNHTIITIQSQRSIDLSPALPYLSRIGTCTLRHGTIAVDAGPEIGTRRLRKKLIMLRNALGVMLEAPVHIGAATNTIVSMVAAKRSGPYGITIVEPGNESSFLETAVIDLLPGIGHRTATYLRNRGIRTIGQFNRLPPYATVKLFGLSGVILHEYSKGNDPRNVVLFNTKKPDSLGRQSLFSIFSKKRYPAFGVAAGVADIA